MESVGFHAQTSLNRGPNHTMKDKMYDGRPTDGMGRMMDTPRMVTFDPPPGLELNGEAGRAMVDWRMEDGQIMITSFDGVSLGGEKPEPEEEEETMVAVKEEEIA